MNKETGAHSYYSLDKNTNHTNLTELLRLRALHQSEQMAYTFLADGETQEVNVTYGELNRRARAIGSLLQKSGATGERVLLFYPPGLDFIYAFFGCLYAGAVAVPLYPPRLNRSLGRLQTVIEDAQAKFALATSSVQSRVEQLFSEAPRLKNIAWIPTDSDSCGCEDDLQELALTGDTLAFLQYTSGSTGAPKGVMISHGNLLHNSVMLSQVFGYNADSKCVSWLPVYHDMGLIGGVIQPLHGGFHCVLLSPAAFLQRPYRWLHAISRYGATISGGPNFAYDLSIQKITPEQRASLDLSSWEVAFNGSEPIKAQTLDRFSSYFEPCGFRREAFYPCYGLAEATLLVSGKAKDGPPVIRNVESANLGCNQFHEASGENESNRRLVGCGQLMANQRIAIVDPRTLTRCAPGQIGEIWIAGESIAKGYWNRTGETDSTFRARIAETGEGPFLRTGDLGILKDGELFVTGRLKDMIIIRGRNHYPQDIEFTVEQATPIVKPASGAAFSVEVDGEEQLVIVYEVNGRKPQNLKAVVDLICQQVAEEHEIQVYSAVLVKPATILKTSSGKIQRQACRTAFLNGTLEVMTEWRRPAAAKTEASLSTLETVADSVEAVEEWLLSQLAARVGCDPCEIDAQQSISRYGIDSLTSVDLAHSIETTLGVSLSVVSLLETSSVAELAAQIFGQLTEPSSAMPSVTPTLQKSTTQNTLSYNQQSLWFLQQLEPANSAYNIAKAARINGDLDVAALRESFQALADRHASLRTSFDSIDGAPVPRVRERAEVFFYEEDCRGWDDESLNNRISEEALRPFDLEEGPLLRVMIFTRSDRDHTLLLVIHHIIADYWSLAILLHELGIMYDAIKAGTKPSLPPLKLQYSDYARWQAEMLAGPNGERLWSHWQKQLSGDIPALDLPTDRPRPPVQTYTGAHHSIAIDRDTSQALKSFSQTREATINMTLQAAFQVLLHRYSGQDDILVGTPTAGRTRADFAPLVGYFVNPVVLRADLSRNPGFDSFLDQTRQGMISALEHQDYPFPLLVDKLHPQRDPGKSPLFQVMFVMQKDRFLEEEGLAAFAIGEAGARIQLKGLSLESLMLEQQVAQFDLTLFLTDMAGELKASIQYNTDLFDRSTIERMLGHFHNLLKAVAANPSGRVSDLPLLTEAEQYQLLVELNSATTVFPQDQCMHDQFEAQVKRTPDAIAIVFKQERLSYRELDERSNQMARHLISLGAEPDMRVGICVERSIEMVVGLLGILKSGASYVPLDPAFPQDRLAFMVKDSEVRVLLTQHHLINALPADAAKIVLLDSDQEVIARESRTKPVNRTKPENLAYVIYTSGSTGQPKGVMLTHRNALNLFYAMDAQVVSDPPGVWMGLTSISFDISVVELFWTLARGFKIVLQEADRSIGAQIKAHKISHFQCTPSMARMLTLEPEYLDSMSTLNKVILAGEVLPPSLAKQIKEVMPGELSNMYGPTEVTVYSTSHAVNRFDNIIPIGRPLANTSAYILDKSLRPVPLGVVGELHLSGNQIARGYLNRPDLTAERFIPDPFSKQSGGRMYRTGDVARFLPDGAIEFRGRSDDQVKIHGYRIELAEIESLLSRHPSVRDVVVIATNDDFEDKILAAYIVPVEDQEPSTKELRDYLGRQLPAYMIPSVFMLLDSIPLTGSGKVNRRLLPKPNAFGQNRQADFAKPQTPVEEVLADIWAEILGGDEVSVRDSFFEMGGNSLSAARLIARLRQIFPVDIQLRSVFTAPTIENLAGIIEGLLLEKIQQMSDDEAERLA